MKILLLVLNYSSCISNIKQILKTVTRNLTYCFNVKIISVSLLFAFYFESTIPNCNPIDYQVENQIEQSKSCKTSLDVKLKNNYKPLKASDQTREHKLKEIAYIFENNDFSAVAKEISSNLDYLEKYIKEDNDSSDINTRRLGPITFKKLTKVKQLIAGLRLLNHFLKKHKHYFKLNETVKDLLKKYNKEFEIISKIKTVIHDELKGHAKKICHNAMSPYLKYIEQLNQDLNYLQHRLDKLAYRYPELENLSVIIKAKLTKIKKFIEIDIDPKK